MRICFLEHSKEAKRPRRPISSVEEDGLRNQHLKMFKNVLRIGRLLVLRSFEKQSERPRSKTKVNVVNSN